jgi:hypothetical protein
VDDVLAAEEEVALAAAFGGAAPALRRGSVVMHECCADAVVDARAAAEARAVARERRAAVEAAVFMGRGRTASLGRDRRSRYYWQFAGEPGLLFIQPFDAKGLAAFEQEAEGGAPVPPIPTAAARLHQASLSAFDPDMLALGPPVPTLTAPRAASASASSSSAMVLSTLGEEERWMVYETPEEIADLVCAYLHANGKRESALRRAILRQYPRVAEIVAAREKGLGQLSAVKADAGAGATKMEEGAGQEEDGPLGRVESGDALMVRRSGLLWPARALCLSGDGRAVRVAYQGWEKADEWVALEEVDAEGRRCLARPTPARLAEREALLEARAVEEKARHTPPAVVESLQAYKFVTSQHRNRPRGRLPTRLTYELRRVRFGDVVELKGFEGLVDMM